MSFGLQRQDGGQENVVGPVKVINNQKNEYHRDVINVTNHYYGGNQSGWKPSRRCATIDFERLSTHFCGRDQEIEQIDGVLRAGEGSLRCAIQGMSGLGKSHLAIKYGKVSYDSEKYTHVFWISVDTEPKLLSGLESILAKLQHPAQHDSDRKNQVEIVKCLLEDAEESQKWLLILDDARRESFTSLRSSLPNKAPYGHMLLTTQFEDVAKEFVKWQQNKSSLLLLQPLAIDDGIRLLIESSDLNPTDLSDQEHERVRRLVRKTGCHPLAITFAAACATSTGTLHDLLDSSSNDQISMITEYEDTLADSDHQVIRRFFDQQVASIKVEPLALDLFRILSFLDNSKISIRTLWRGIQFVHDMKLDPSTNEDSRETPGNPQKELPSFFSCGMPQLQKCIRKLTGQNLIQMAIPGVVIIHDLTNHLSLQSMEDAGVKVQYHDYACQLMLSSFNSIKEPSQRDNWAASDELIMHFSKLFSDVDDKNSYLDTSLDRAARYLFKRGRYSESQTLHNRLLNTRKSSLGPTHRYTLSTTHYLAVLHSLQGHYKISEELFEFLLSEREKQLGRQHPDSLLTMQDLAGVYRAQGHYEKAEDLYHRILPESEETLGPSHRDTLTTMQSLAFVYELKGHYSKAKDLYLRVSATEEKMVGVAHPRTLAALHGLASVSECQGLYRESEEIYLRVLPEREKLLGPEHPATLSTMRDLASVYRSQGRYSDAEQLLQHVLKERRGRLGLKHPHTLFTLYSLAHLHEDQGLYQQSDELYEVLLVEQKAQLGPNHPNTLITMHNSARVWAHQGRHRESEDLFQHVLSEQMQQHGVKHPNTLLTMHSIADLRRAEHRYQEAEELYKEVLARRKEYLGPEHPATLLTTQNLADVYVSQGRFVEAEPLFHFALDGRQKIFGRDHDFTTSVHAKLDNVRRKISENRA